MSRRSDRSGNGARLLRASIDRRQFLRALSAPLLAGLLPQEAHALAVHAARLWPAREYTRMTLESASPIAHQLIAVKNPERLVLDLEGVDVSIELQQLSGKVQVTDPYIQGI